VEDWASEEVEMRTVVVGVDGSLGARTALRFAVEEAALRGAKLHALCAWEIAWGIPGGTVPPPALQEFRDHADRVVEDAVAEAARLDAAIECTGMAVHGQAASRLVEAAGPNDLIVVGSRGRGGFAGLVLGSVSQQVVQHARCPVLVVPSRGGEPSEPGGS
jgi:nucleotide-binding universal stress UspA family protein